MKKKKILFYDILYISYNMADEYTYASSIAPQDTDFEFSSRQYVWIADNNNGSYNSGQVVFDLAGLSNSGKFVDWSQTYLTIPLILNVNSSAGAFATANVENAFSASLKNSVFQLINSLSVEITNNSVVNLTNFSNIDINYKFMNRVSSEELENLAPSLLFSKDTAESIGYSGVASSQGLGEYNNTIKQTVFTSAGGYGTTSLTQNAGRAKRMLDTSFDPASASASNFISATGCNTAGKDYVTYTTTNITFNIMATIPLRFLHDIFAKLPLSKGIYMRLILNTNTQSQIVLNLGGTGTTYSSLSSVYSPNGVIPFMLSPLGTTNGFVAGGTCTQVTASLGIGRSLVPAGTFSHPSFTQARIYASVYEMSPLYEEKYFQMVPTKTIKYNDILSFQVLNVAPGASFSSILTNGVSRARGILIAPYLSATVNGSASIFNQTGYTAGVGQFSTFNSPFSTSPATTCPFAFITQFNVLVSGSAIYQSNLNYRFEHFLQELRASEGLNGGLSLGMSSGIIGQSDYENGYGYIYVDLSRKMNQAQDDISRSIQIIGTNSSGVQLDLMAIISYEREITLSTSTGSLVI